MRDLAASCARTQVVKTHDKLSAAQHQLEAAIADLFVGNWPSAITLAGAAEDILPPHEARPDLFTVAKGLSGKRFNESPKEIVEVLNEKRNWLKHDQSRDLKDTQTFTQEDAVIMILRASTRFDAHNNGVQSENLAIFREWFRTHYGDWL